MASFTEIMNVKFELSYAIASHHLRTSQLLLLHVFLQTPLQLAQLQYGILTTLAAYCTVSNQLTGRKATRIFWPLKYLIERTVASILCRIIQ